MKESEVLSYTPNFTIISARVGVYGQGRHHGFESGGGTILRAERAKKIFWPPHFLSSGGDKILLRQLSQPNSFVWFVADWHWCWYFLLLFLCFER